jgi:osmotically-inducible protein OsmY
MKTIKACALLLSGLVVGASVGCSSTSVKSADVSSSIRQTLDQAGLKDVSVKQDRDNGVVTLGGHVATESDKYRAEAVAKQVALSQVVSNEIAVLPPGSESAAKAINSDLDKGIEKDLDAALIQNGLDKIVKHSVKNGVVTLRGEADSQSTRAAAARIAATVPNVQQVVNEVQVKHQKATSTR